MRFCVDRIFVCVTIVMEKRKYTGLYHDSRKVTAGSLFFDLSGSVKYVKQAIKNGATAIVTAKPIVLSDKMVRQIVVPDVRVAMSTMSKEYFGGYVDKMKIIGVVGTNGKTTVTHMLRHILGRETGAIGTLGIFYGDAFEENPLTTPDPIEMHQVFARMYNAGTRVIAMETSAHAIHFAKLAGINFEAVIFTNITVDHLDFFHTFENYSNTKINFFLTDKNSKIKTAIINIDNEFGRRIIKERKGNSVSYSADGAQIKLYADRSTFVFEGHNVTVNMPALFNVYNALACLTCAKVLGVSVAKAVKALGNIPTIAGRFQTFALKSGAVAIVDYAHTPDGLEKVITSVRETSRGARIFTVFGCGGERDKTKRPIMGEISAKYSDYTIITNDNPRKEKPTAIFKQIEQGVKRVSDKYTIIEDRAEAIKLAIYKAKKGDVIIIAGKGAETTMEIGGEFIPYSDADVLNEYTQNCTQ